MRRREPRIFPAMTPPVHIAMSVHNGVRFLRDQVRSIQAQSHEDWVLWIRDDGSTDETPTLLADLSASDPRVRVHPGDGERLGTTLCHDWLLSRIPPEAAYVFSCDADDVWLPHKIERSLAVMKDAEERHGGAVLVHSDLTVVDASLDPIAASLWDYNHTPPEPTTLARLSVANVATGPTLLLNRALLDEVLPIPAAAAFHDSWIALVAAAFGRIVAIREPTVLYRRHTANVTSLAGSGERTAVGVLARLAAAPGNAQAVRRWVLATARQADAFLQRFEERLDPADAHALRDLAAVPRLGIVKRKLGVWRHHALPERGLVRNLGFVLRA